MKVIVLLFSFLIGIPAWSQMAGGLFTYEGVLTDTGGTPITTSQTVTFQIIHSGACIAYEEDQNITPGSQGEFSAVVGSGTRTDATVNTIDRIFASSNQISCKGGSSTTVSGFPVLHIKIAAVDLTPDIQITNVPYAVNSQKLADKGPADFIQGNNLKNLTQVNLENFFGDAGFSNITNVLGGSYSPATAGNVTGTVAIANGGTGATTATGAINALLPAQTANGGKYLTTDGTNVSWAAVAGGASGPAGGDLTGNYPNPTLTASGVIAGTYGATNKTIYSIQVDATGRITSIIDGLISLNGNQITAGTIGTGFGGTGLSTLGTANQILGVNSAGSGLEYKNITAGANITVTHTAGDIQIAASGGGGGSVTNVTSVNSDISVVNGTSTPSLTLNSGTSGGIGDANKIAKLNASGLLNLGMIPVIPIAQGGTGSSTALNNNRIMASSGGAIVEAPAITADKALVSDINGIPTSSSVSLTELSYVAGVSSSIQTQLNAKANSSSWANYSVIGVNGVGNLVAIPGATSNTMLQWSVAGPVWTSAAYPLSTTANQLLYSSANDVIGGLPTANNAILMTDGTGVPSWSVMSNDNFGQYALLGGRGGGQVLNGGISANEKLTLESTSSPTKGDILLNPNGGNVGIGTSAPSAVLHTVASGNKTTDYIGNIISNVATTSTGLIRKIGLDVQSTGVWTGSDSVNTGLNVNVSGGTWNYAATFNGGYVGIGTNNPKSDLVVQGNGTTPKFFIQNSDFVFNSTGSAISIALQSPNNSAVARIQSYDYFSGTPVLSLQPNTGRVGIGTTTPQGELDVVNGDADTSISILNKGSVFSAKSPKLQIRNYTGGLSGSAPRIVFSNSGGSSTMPAAIVANDVLGSIDFFGNFDNTYSTAGGPAIIVAASNSWSGSSTPTYMSFKTMGGGFNVATEAMRIDSTGNVGIGFSNPTYKLHVNGSANGIAWTTTSDKRFKKNIKNLNESLDKITQLRGVSYDWRKSEFPDRNFSDEKQVGFIAQEVEKVFPEVVTEDKDGFRAVQYSNLIAPVVEAIKELYNKFMDQQDYIEQQKRSIASLEAKNNDIKNENIKMTYQIEKLKSENQEIKARLDNLEKAVLGRR